MTEISSDKRKYFRFPAFDDNTGVKLTQGEERVLFANDEQIYAQPNHYYERKEDLTYEQRFLNEEREFPEKEVYEVPPYEVKQPKAVYTKESIQQRERKAVDKKQGLFHQSMHKTVAQTNLSRNTQNKPYFSNQKGNTNQSSSETRSRVSHSHRPSKNTNSSKATGNQGFGGYPERSYFVPKYIPASIPPEAKKSNFAREELMHAMKKTKTSYLLFSKEEEKTAFIEKKSEAEPTVQKFKKDSTLSSIPVTRRQFQQIKNTDADTFSDSELESMLPKSRREFKEAKSKARSQTAYGRKQEINEQETKKKSSRLEKSLSGIMADETKALTENKYFD